jgi:hypothetical protein
VSVSAFFLSSRVRPHVLLAFDSHTCPYDSVGPAQWTPAHTLPPPPPPPCSSGGGGSGGPEVLMVAVVPSLPPAPAPSPAPRPMCFTTTSPVAVTPQPRSPLAAAAAAAAPRNSRATRRLFAACPPQPPAQGPPRRVRRLTPRALALALEATTTENKTAGVSRQLLLATAAGPKRGREGSSPKEPHPTLTSSKLSTCTYAPGRLAQPLSEPAVVLPDTLEEEGALVRPAASRRARRGRMRQCTPPSFHGHFHLVDRRTPRIPRVACCWVLAAAGQPVGRVFRQTTMRQTPTSG